MRSEDRTRKKRGIKRETTKRDTEAKDITSDTNMKYENKVGMEQEVVNNKEAITRNLQTLQQQEIIWKEEGHKEAIIEKPAEHSNMAQEKKRELHEIQRNKEGNRGISKVNIK